MKNRIKDDLKLEYAVLRRMILTLIVYYNVQVQSAVIDIAYKENISINSKVESLMSPLLLHSFVNELLILI